VEKAAAARISAAQIEKLFNIVVLLRLNFLGFLTPNEVAFILSISEKKQSSGCNAQERPTSSKSFTRVPEPPMAHSEVNDARLLLVSARKSRGEARVTEADQ
jgi:hypothetical protein